MSLVLFCLLFSSIDYVPVKLFLFFNLSFYCCSSTVVSIFLRYSPQPHPSPPPNLDLPPLALSMCPLYMFLNDSSPIFPHIFLMLSFKSFLSILNKSPLSYVSFANNSPNICLVFHSLDRVLHSAKVFNFNEYNLHITSTMDCVFGDISKMSSSYQRSSCYFEKFS